MECHDAGVLGTGGRRPRDALIGRLLGNPCVPFLGLAADLGDPVEPLVVELVHPLDGGHELRELLELGPLVVGRPNGNLDVDRFGDVGHTICSPRIGARGPEKPRTPTELLGERPESL
jgi:hypothetical protein